MKNTEFIKVDDGQLALYDIELSSYPALVSKIHDLELLRLDLISKIKMLAVSDPVNLKKKDENLIDTINSEIVDFIDDYDSVIKKLSNYMLVLRLTQRYAAKYSVPYNDAFNSILIDKYADIRSKLNEKA